MNRSSNITPYAVVLYAMKYVAAMWLDTKRTTVILPRIKLPPIKASI